MGKGMEIPREHRMLMRDTSRQSLTTFSEEGTSGVWFVLSYDNGSCSNGVHIVINVFFHCSVVVYTVIYCDIL